MGLSPQYLDQGDDYTSDALDMMNFGLCVFEKLDVWGELLCSWIVLELESIGQNIWCLTTYFRKYLGTGESDVVSIFEKLANAWHKKKTAPLI